MSKWMSTNLINGMFIALLILSASVSFILGCLQYKIRINLTTLIFVSFDSLTSAQAFLFLVRIHITTIQIYPLVNHNITLNIIEHTFTAINHLHCFDIFRQVSVLSDVDFRRNIAKKFEKIF